MSGKLFIQQTAFGKNIVFDILCNYYPVRSAADSAIFYKVLLAELRQRVEDGVAAIDNERFRIYWEGMPIWGKLRDLSDQFSSLNTCVLASTYSIPKILLTVWNAPTSSCSLFGMKTTKNNTSKIRSGATR